MDNELNERIAFEVMGYEWRTDKYNVMRTLTRTTIKHSAEMGDYPYTELLLGGCPNYSGDIAAAWLVVEELAKRDIWLYNLRQFSLGERWVAEFRNRDHTIIVTSVFSSTAPLAICHAALDICEKLKKEGVP